MNTRIVTVILLIGIVLMLSSSCAPSYDEDWIIGKTDDEIIERYGQFDMRYNNYCEDGTYNGWIGCYILKEKRVGYLQTYPEEGLKIKFDQNNVATNCNDFLGRPGN